MSFPFPPKKELPALKTVSCSNCFSSAFLSYTVILNKSLKVTNFGATPGSLHISQCIYLSGDSFSVLSITEWSLVCKYSFILHTAKITHYNRFVLQKRINVMHSENKRKNTCPSSQKNNSIKSVALPP